MLAQSTKAQVDHRHPGAGIDVGADGTAAESPRAQHGYVRVAHEYGPHVARLLEDALGVVVEALKKGDVFA